MTPQEYKQFLESMYKEYIASRVGAKGIDGEKFISNMRRVQQTAQRLSQLEERSEKWTDVEFAKEGTFLKLLMEVSASVDYSREFFESSGIFDMLDRHLDALAENAHLIDSPQFERDLLAKLGSSDPNGELATSIKALQNFARLVKAKEGTDCRALLHGVKGDLIKVQNDVQIISQSVQQVSVKRRRPWIEGSGKIIRGVGAAGFDLAAGYGFLPTLGFNLALPTGGLIVLSILNGVGLIVEGVGKISQR